MWGTNIEKIWHILIDRKLLCRIVVVGIPGVVKDVTFIQLKVATRSAFKTEKYNKTGTYGMSLSFFISNE
jgi:hypothetical protein